VLSKQPWPHGPLSQNSLESVFTNIADQISRPDIIQNIQFQLVGKSASSRYRFQREEVKYKINRGDVKFYEEMKTFFGQMINEDRRKAYEILIEVDQEQDDGDLEISGMGEESSIEV